MLEREIPCSEGYVNHLVHGRRQPSAEVAARIEELLKIRAKLWGQFEETVAA